MENQKIYSGPKRFAHRGLVQYAPENTLGAFEAAIDHGCEGIEIDIQMSADGEVIVAHDANFTRMTLGHPTSPSNARLREMPWEKICQMELPFANHILSKELPEHTEVEQMAIMPQRLMGQEKGSDYIAALEKDPRMTHLMRFCEFDEWLATRKENIEIEVEFKAPGMMPRMLEILRNSKNIHRYIFFSGVPEYLEEIQGACKREGKPEGLRLGANIRWLNEEQKAFVERSDLFEVGLNAWHMGEDNCKWLKDRGIEILSNLGDYPDWWKEICKAGIYGFKTNYAEAFTAWWTGDNR